MSDLAIPLEDIVFVETPTDLCDRAFRADALVCLRKTYSDEYLLHTGMVTPAELALHLADY